MFVESLSSICLYDGGMRAARAEELEDWKSIHRLTPEGAVESEQYAALRPAAVEHSREGACELGCLYWSEVERSTFGLVRVRYVASSDREQQVELRVLDRGPVLLVFAPADIVVSGDGVTCRFPIRGGLLARGPRGSLALTQLRLPVPGLRSVITGFYPRLAAQPGQPRWSRPFYALVQHRLHVWISRRFFRALAERPRR